MAVFLRESPKHYPEDFDEYRTGLAKVCARCEPEYGFSGIVGFIYASVKDSIKDEGLSVKRFRTAVMSIGRIVYLDNEKFSEVLYSSGTVGVKDMTADEINRMAGV